MESGYDIDSQITDVIMDVEKAYKLLINKLQHWLEILVTMLPNFILAALVVLAFYIGARVTRNLSIKLFDRFSKKPAFNKLIGNIIYLMVIGAGLFAALSVMQLDKTVTSLLAGAGIIGLAFSFAFQNTAANFMSGIILTVKSPFEIGDIVETNDFFGKIKHIHLRTTVLETFQGQEVYLPNKEVIENPVQNFSKKGKRRIDLNVGISYGDSLPKVKEITIKAIEQLDGLIKNEEIKLFFKEFGTSSINFTVMFWIRYLNEVDFLKARSEAVMNIKKAFDEHEITIPFPIRTLDFGIKGGERLAEVLQSEVLKIKSQNGRESA